MHIINTNNYITWSKSNIPRKKLLISLEYLDSDLLNSLINNFNLDLNSNNIDICILFKGCYDDFFSYSSDIKTLQYLHNISSDKIKVKRNTTLDFSGFLVDNTNLFTLQSDTKSYSSSNSYTKPNYLIDDFITKFNSIFEISEDIDLCYNKILSAYISNTINLDEKIDHYISLVKNNNINYKYSCFFSRYSDDVKLSASLVPQFSSFEKGAYTLPLLLKNFDNLGYTFLEVGKLLLPPGKKDGAYTKYGENHSKLAESLGLVYISNSTKLKTVYLSDLGYKFLNLSDINKDLLLKYQIYNLPLIKYLFNICFDNIINIEDFILIISNLSISTSKRRSSNIKALINILIDNCNNENILSIWSNCLNYKNLNTKKNKKYIFSSQDKNNILDLINSKLTKGIHFISMESIYKLIRLYEPTLLKINNVCDTSRLSDLLSEIFIGTDFVTSCDIVTKEISYVNDPFKYFIENNYLINRNEFFSYFIDVGYDINLISKKFHEYECNFIRLDFDTYILKSNFNIALEDINTIRIVFNNILSKNEFITLFDFSTINKLPNIKYECNHYLVASIISHYLTDEFTLIYKYSSRTYLYKYLFITTKDSCLLDFTDLLTLIVRTCYHEFDSVSFKELESYLIVNNIIPGSLCRSFIDYSKVSIDEFDRITII